MQRKTTALSIKTTDDETGTFTGLASVFDNLDAHGDIVRRGAFAKSLASGRQVPLIWEHKAADPRNYVGDVVEATETTEGLAIVGKFDLATEHGQAAYRNVKGRRVGGLSIGYYVKNNTKTAAGNELTELDLVEISVVARGANDRALIGAVKSADTRNALREKVARAQLQAKENAMHTTHTTASKDTGDRFTKDRDTQLAAARQIVELAAELDRDLTAAEADQVQKHLDAAEAATKAHAEAKRHVDIMAKLDAMALQLPDGKPAGTDRDSTGGMTFAKTDGNRLAFTKGMAARAVTKILGEQPLGGGQKAVAPSGAAVVATEFKPDPIALGQPATSLLSVLPVAIHTDSPAFSYLRQSVRTNNAAVVAEGAVKPTSVHSVTKVDNQLAVVAHLSEALPRYWIADNASLQEWLTSELTYGLSLAVEAMALTAIGTTSGIQTNAYSVSPLVTLRKSLTKLEANGYTPAAVVLHPLDWETIELALASPNAIEHMSLPYDPVARRLYGVPIVLTTAAAQGTAHTLSDGCAALDTDGTVAIQWSESSNADDWSKNLIRARCEGRFATSIYRPLGVVKSTLTT